MRKWFLVIAVPLTLVFLTVASFLIAAQVGKPAPDNSLAGVGSYRTVDLRLDSKVFSLDIADTSAKQQRGLGSRDSLAADRGMVFLYADAGQRCFWMKDMRFAIDILWLDAQKRVGHIERSVSPDTYPQTYCPAVAARYVIELQAGMAKTAGIEVGESLPLEL